MRLLRSPPKGRLGFGFLWATNQPGFLTPCCLHRAMAGAARKLTCLVRGALSPARSDQACNPKVGKRKCPNKLYLNLINLIDYNQI